MINDKPTMDALAHYGVKGMKWGVRRQIKKDSRNAARLNKQYNKYREKSYKSYVKSNQQSEKNTKKAEKSMEKATNYAKKAKAIENYRKTLIKDMSDSDIIQGENYIKNKRTASIILGAGPGLAMLGQEAVQTKRITKKASN